MAISVIAQNHERFIILELVFEIISRSLSCLQSLDIFRDIQNVTDYSSAANPMFTQFWWK